MTKLTKAQRNNLLNIEETGKPTRGSRAGYNCRVLGFSEFVWAMSDGSEATSTEVDAMPKPLPETRCCVRVIRERLTDAGRAALSSHKED